MDGRRKLALTLSDTVMPSPEAVVQALSGEAVLLDLASGTYSGLDDVGTRFWQPLTLRASQSGALGCVLEEPDAEQVRLETDPLARIGVLANDGLMTLGDGDEPAP